VRHAPGTQSACRSFTGLASAEKEHAALPQIAEDFSSEFYRDRADRDRAAGDIGGAAHLLRNPKRSLKDAMQQRPGVAGGASALIRFLHLPEDLGLADHHRIQPGDHAEKMLEAGFVI